jgi:L-galactose dehydrogenase
LGQTELNVSIIGFGASPLGDVFGPVDPAEGGRAVSSAIDLGINFFDVSPYYGRTLAEERLGDALVGRRDSIILATKCGRYGPQDFDFSAERVRQGVEESLKRLRTDYVGLFDLAVSLPTCPFPPASVSGGGRSLWFDNRHPSL